MSDVVVNEILRQAEAGSFVGIIKEWWDAEVARLVLRARGWKSNYLYRRRDVTVNLGAADIVDVKEARFRAALVHEVLIQGGSAQEAKEAVRVVEQKKRMHADPVVAHHEAMKVMLRDHGGGSDHAWTWHEMREAYIAQRVSTLGEKWSPQVAALLRDERFELVAHRPVRSLVFDDVENVISRIEAEKGCGRAKRIVGIVKQMLDWASAAQRAKHSGLPREPKWWNDLEVDHQTSVRSHTPMIRELVKTIIVVEDMVDREFSPVSPGTLGMLWATVLLVQRTGQLGFMTRQRLLLANTPDEYAHDYDFEEDGEGIPARKQLDPGWRIFTWSADEMKGRKGQSLPHVLPIPPAATAILTRYAAGSRYLFPSSKKDGPCTQSALTQLFRRLAGVRDTGRASTKRSREGSTSEGRGYDHFAANGIRPWTPHDVRRTATAFLDHHKLGGAGSAILSHRESRDGEKAAHERMLPVTKLHYHHDQRVFLKAEGLGLWVKRVLQEYEAQKALSKQSMAGEAR